MPHSDERVRARLNELEDEARHHPRRHALRLTLLVALGFAYPLALLLASFALIVLISWVGPVLWREGLAVVWVVLEFVALLIMVLVLRAFRINLPPPDGHTLQPQEAPALRALLAEALAAMDQDIRVDHLMIHWSFNAGAAQRLRFGLWGPATNYVMVGLPLMMAVTPAELKAVIAHELGHMQGRHNSFSAWIYRMFQTWEALSVPWGRGRAWRRVLVGWFTRWYAQYFATTTLALRRLHEYAADRRSADTVGTAAAASALLQISQQEYRLEKQFWPAVFRGAAGEPLPPKDVMGMLAETIAAPLPPVVQQRWRTAELRARTPITAEHPCLLDRLKALNEAAQLQRPPADPPSTPMSALHLLGESQTKLLNVGNALWKGVIIGRWRGMHAYEKYEREQGARHPMRVAQDDSTDAVWLPLQHALPMLAADAAIERLRAFLGDHPQHAPANFELARLLLDQDDDAAADSFEAAMAGSSEFIGPALQMLLDYYRSAGRDAQADPIARKLEAHEQAMMVARSERSKVGRRDRFMPHGLDEEVLVKVRRVLNRYPQVRDAYLVKKQVKLFSDQPSYVLAVHRRVRSLDDQRRADRALIACLGSDMEFPCAVCILGWTSPRLAARIMRACPQPVFAPGT
jgi:Zn-dependent protease with chaperone function